jgi:hypothetical protein
VLCVEFSGIGLPPAVVVLKGTVQEADGCKNNKNGWGMMAGRVLAGGGRGGLALREDQRTEKITYQ